MARLSYIVGIIGIVLICVFAQDSYDTKYDDVDVNGILENDKLREQYFKCFMDQGPCVTADAKFFKEIIGEAHHTQCRKCNEKQKVMLNAVVEWYKANAPDKYTAFDEKTREDLKKKGIL